MHQKDIERIVNQALAEEFELDPELLQPSAHIRDDLGLDSLDIVDMVIVIEKAFNFKLEDKSPLAQIATLDDLYRFIGTLHGQSV